FLQDLNPIFGGSWRQNERRGRRSEAAPHRQELLFFFGFFKTLDPGVGRSVGADAYRPSGLPRTRENPLFPFPPIPDCALKLRLRTSVLSHSAHTKRKKIP